MRVTFEAEIMEKKEKIDVDGCMSGRMVIQYTPCDELRHDLVSIFRAQSTIFVTLENQEEYGQTKEE
jgi:hypothetical protein